MMSKGVWEIAQSPIINTAQSVWYSMGWKQEKQSVGGARVICLQVFSARATDEQSQYISLPLPHTFASFIWSQLILRGFTSFSYLDVTFSEDQQGTFQRMTPQTCTTCLGVVTVLCMPPVSHSLPGTGYGTTGVKRPRKILQGGKIKGRDGK